MAAALVLALVIAVLAATFALQNPDPVTVWFLAWKTEGSLALVLLLTFAAGTALGLLLMVPALVRGNLALRRLRGERPPAPPAP